MKKVELLSPAGSYKKLIYAIEYGADSVYAGIRNFSLRSSGLTLDELRKCTKYAKEKNKNIYFALNIFAQNKDIKELEKVISEVDKIGPDGLIIADPGVFSLVKKRTNIPIHISTQANVTNVESALFWQGHGAKSITLARELSLQEIEEISQKTDLEIEVFVHGAMCLSYSGRCYLSKYLNERDANRGDCSQPCRWNYKIQNSKPKMQNESMVEGNVCVGQCEEKLSSLQCQGMENERNAIENKMELIEDKRGTYILSSTDLMLIEYLPQLIEAGVNCFKIEGRMKSIHYVSTVTKAYRQAIDLYNNSPSNFKVKKEWLDELNKISHRPYSTGFIKSEAKQVQGLQSYSKEAEFVGEVTGENNGLIKIAVKNKLNSGELLDVLVPEGDNLSWKIKNMINIKTGQALDDAHANYVVTAKGKLPKYSLLRRNNAN